MGFSQQGRVHETEADLAEKKRKLAAQLDEKRMRAEANATIRATQVQGLRQMAQALRQGGQADQTTATEDLPQLPLAGNGHAPRSS
jgi:predicted RNA-binding Zn ribbon-like protein